LLRVQLPKIRLNLTKKLANTYCEILQHLVAALLIDLLVLILLGSHEHWRLFYLLFRILFLFIDRAAVY
jgi:hypothetical protein